MRIARIETTPVSIPIHTVYTMARGAHHALRTIVVRLHTDEGIEGIGEAHEGVAGYHYETLDTMREIIERNYAPRLIGVTLDDARQVLADLDTVRSGNPFARSALDIAVHDAYGKAVGASITQMLGGSMRTDIGLSAPIGIGTPEDMAKRATELVKSGYTTVKLKVGTGGVPIDIERVRAAREAIGPDIALRIDANAAYTLGDALRFAAGVLTYDPEHIEQPVPGTDLASLQRLRQSFPIPLMVDESVRTHQDAYQVLSTGAADLLKIKLTKVGGFGNARKIIAVAEAAGASVIIGQGMCSSIEAVAELHMIASHPTVNGVGELAGPSQIVRDLVTEPLSPSQGRVSVPERPGLGLELDGESLEQYAITAAARCA